MRDRIIIAIDGYSSCGKSTLATELAASLSYVHIDSGAMYRAVALYFLEYDIPISDPEEVALALEQITISFRHAHDQQVTLLNNVDVERRIREADVNQMVSPVAAISAVRKALVAQQRMMGAAGGIVMDGRDIGTVVFPDAELKIFLTASLEIRVERRYAELIGKGYQITRAEVAESLAYRDHIDTTRADSPLRQAADAIVIDNTGLTREDQLSMALGYAQKRILEAS